jgi:hypothetical protein
MKRRIQINRSYSTFKRYVTCMHTLVNFIQMNNESEALAGCTVTLLLQQGVFVTSLI